MKKDESKNQIHSIVS